MTEISKGQLKRIWYQKGIKSGKLEILEELIKVFKDREPLEQYTTNVILLELKGRKIQIEENLVSQNGGYTK